MKQMLLNIYAILHYFPNYIAVRAQNLLKLVVNSATKISSKSNTEAIGQSKSEVVKLK